MSIKNNNLSILIFLGILFICILNLCKEEFQIINCLHGKIEGSDGKCTCPLVGQIYNTKKQICMCDNNKTETVINNKTVCM